MSFVSDEYTGLYVARVWDFFNRHGPWHKALWSIGSVLRLHEVLEYAELTASKAFPTDEGLKYVTQAATTAVGIDPGIRGPERQKVLELLDVKELIKKESQRAALLHLNEVISMNYLPTLRTNHEVPADPPAVELSARLFAAQLIDRGLNMDFLLRWLKDLATDESVELSLSDLIDEAAALVKSGERKYRVLAPIFSVPDYGAPQPQSWLTAEQTAEWIAGQEAPLPEGFRQNGAFMIEVTALDPWSAVESARDVLVRTHTRMTLGARTRSLETAGKAWVEGEPRVFPLRLGRLRNQVRLRSLDRSDEIFSGDSSAQSKALDDALELAASLEEGTRGSALTGGWAAVEGLLSTGDGAIAAAGRFAAIVACSFPTAQLAPLSYAHSQSSDDALATELETQPSSTARASILEAALRGGTHPSIERASDQAMLQRVQALFADPYNVLARVRGYIDDSMRRLYTQRNLIMHAGRFDSVALSATLRTAPHLVGAGLDRILAAADIMSPQRLGARAEMELSLLENDPGRQLTALLPA